MKKLTKYSSFEDLKSSNIEEGEKIKIDKSKKEFKDFIEKLLKSKQKNEKK
jgi:predicted DNA-binding antitoxin AbrB/MazE fold protein